jgi:hypothetical protein
MAAMEREVIPLHMNSGHGLGVFVNGIIEFLGHRTYLNAAPKIAGMALRTFLWIHLNHLHLIYPP